MKELEKEIEKCYVCGNEIRWVNTTTTDRVITKRQAHIKDGTFAGFGTCEYFSFMDELKAL